MTDRMKQLIEERRRSIEFILGKRLDDINIKDPAELVLSLSPEELMLMPDSYLDQLCDELLKSEE